MGYSKEQERQNQVLKDLLSGREPEKRVFVGYEGEKETHSGDKIDKMTEIMQDVRMPLFCPKCKKVMKHRLDDKMWTLYNNWFNCQMEFENKLRISGEYEEWEANKLKENKKAFLKEQIQALQEWKETKSPSWFNDVGVNYPELEEEKWSGDFEKIQKETQEALDAYQKLLDEMENE